MRDITKLDVENIDEYGRYDDGKSGYHFRLSDEEIIEIRRFHHNRLLAKKRLKMREKSQIVDVYNEKLLKKMLRLHRFKKKNRIKKRWFNNDNTLVLNKGIGVNLITGAIFGRTITTGNNVSTEDLKEKRELLIKKYCDVYQVDYNIVYNLLVRLTDNFTSVEFHSGRIPVINGNDIYAKSEEELFVYAIRNIKRTPEKFNLKKEDLYIDTDYISDTEYFRQIKYYANLFDVDECLIAAIVQTETGFDSDIFNSINNPAGLKTNGRLEKFANKEEGFIELCLEIRNVYRKIGCLSNQVNSNIIVAIGAAWPFFSSSNRYWVSNVIDNYYKYRNNYEEFFNHAVERQIKVA